MKFSAAFASICALFLIVFTVPAMCEVIQIQVSPSTLNLEYPGTIVTCHTDIAYSAVVAASVALNGIPIDWWKEDNRGNFVAKFTSADVKDWFDENWEGIEYVELTLTGKTDSGVAFSGTDTIRVVRIIPKK